jgi:hypothetical protein
MKIVGYVLLLGAFAYIMIDATVGMSEREAIWLGRTDKALRASGLPMENPVVNVCFEMNRSWASANRAIAVPAIVMVVGAMLLDVAGRRKRKQDQQEPQPGGGG